MVCSQLSGVECLSWKSNLAILQDADAAAVAADAPSDPRLAVTPLETHVLKGASHVRAWCARAFRSRGGGGGGGLWILKDALANGGNGIWIVDAVNWPAVAEQVGLYEAAGSDSPQSDNVRCKELLPCFPCRTLLLLRLLHASSSVPSRSLFFSIAAVT